MTKLFNLILLSLLLLPTCFAQQGLAPVNPRLRSDFEQTRRWIANATHAKDWNWVPSPQVMRRRPQFPAGGGTTPDTISSTLKIWHKADNGTGGSSDGDQVTTWTDQSGNGINPTQATSSKRPLYKTNIQNSKPGVLFDGTDDFLYDDSFTSISQPYTMQIVFKLVTNVDSRITEATHANRSMWGSNGSVWIYYAGGGAFIGAGTADTSIHVAQVLFNGASSQVWIDGTSTSTGNPGSNGFADLSFGAYTDGTGNANVYIFEYCVWAGDIGSTDRTAMHDYARGASRWNF